MSVGLGVLSVDEGVDPGVDVASVESLSLSALAQAPSPSSAATASAAIDGLMCKVFLPSRQRAKTM